MYLPGVIIFIRSIWLGLVLNFVLSALSDTSFLSNDILADDTGSDVFLPETDEYSLTDQFPDTAPAGDDFFDDTLFADDILANNAQSCGQPLGKVRARENSCPSLEPPAHSTFTESDERTLTADEVEKYWCGDNPAKLSLHHTPVCSLEPYTGPIVNNLRSYMRQSLNLISLAQQNGALSKNLQCQV